MVSLNETRTNIPRNWLNNYNATREQKHGLGGVAMLLEEGITYARKKVELSRQHLVNNSVKYFKIDLVRT